MAGSEPEPGASREFGPRFEEGFDPKRPWRMTLAEAERILAAEAEGALNVDDPVIARELAEAKRIVVRARLWGGTAETVNRRYLRRGIWFGIAVVAFFAIALLVPLLLHLIPQL